MNDSEEDDPWGSSAFSHYPGGGSKYPVHDCCEFQGAEQLKALLYVRQYSSDDDSSTNSDNVHPSTIETNNANKDNGEENNHDKVKDPMSMDTQQDHENPVNTNEEDKDDIKEPRYYCPFDLNERDEDENTPLHVAIHALKLDCVELLIGAGVAINRRSDGSTPLHLAISLGAIPQNKTFSLNCVKLLIEHGADLLIRDESSQSPLLLATRLNLYDIVDYILTQTETGPYTLEKCDRLGNRPLTAINAGTAPALTTLLLTHTARLSAAAAIDGLDSNATTAATNPNSSSNSSGNKKHYKHLKNGQGRTSLHQAMSCGNWAVARVLLQHDDVMFAQLDTADSNHHHDGTMNSNASMDMDSNRNGDATVEHAKDTTTIASTTKTKSATIHTNHIHESKPMETKQHHHTRLKDVKDRRGMTALDLSLHRGFVPPNDLLSLLHNPTNNNNITHRDMILDPPSNTLASTHDICSTHYTCPPSHFTHRSNRNSSTADPPPENTRRLHVLLDPKVGILHSNEFSNSLIFHTTPPRIHIADVLRVHSYPYIDRISTLCSNLASSEMVVNLDADTAVSKNSFEAAMYAAGAVVEAVDKVMSGDYRNAFLPLRPPGHHAGPDGVVTCANDPDGSHGFCLINHVAVAAAYFRATYKGKVAILDFDVHHGNGTEECIARALLPRMHKNSIQLPEPLSASMVWSKGTYHPWLNEQDADCVFFASTHGYGAREDCVVYGAGAAQQQGWFYPASGESFVSSSIAQIGDDDEDNDNEIDRNKPNIAEFLQSQTWARIPEEQRKHACKIMNCGLSRREEYGVEANAMQRLELRESYRMKILPALAKFNPDIILLSAGFDAHKRDSMNQGFIGMVEDDYEWLTQQIVKVANSCCQGKVVSVLEGGYKIHGGIISPFARSVAAHVRGLVDGGKSRELWSDDDAKWENDFEKSMMEDKLKRRELRSTRSQQHRMMQELNHQQQSQQQKSNGNGAHHLKEENQQIVSDFVTEHSNTVNDKLEDKDSQQAQSQAPQEVENVQRDQEQHSNNNIDALFHEPLNDHTTTHHNAVENISGDDTLPRKRRRPQVDYKQLYEKMKKEETSNKVP